MGADQLGLLLWKNYVVRKRRPAILGLVFLWPIVIFMLLYIVRDNVEPEYNPTCQFPARLMPRDGLLPFVQSYICSIGNPCDPLDNYEEIPLYKNAKLGPLMLEFQSILPNRTILTAVKTLPQSVKFLRSMIEILTKPEIKKLFDRGIRLGDLFNNHDLLKSTIITELPGVREDFIDDFFDTSIKLYYLIESFGSTNIESVVCSPLALKDFLIVKSDEDLYQISELLCHLDAEKIPIILKKLSQHLDFTGLLEIVSRVMAKFRDYDFIGDIRNAVETVLKLDTLDKYVPKYLKLREWIPGFIELFRNVEIKKIDLGFIGRLVEQLDTVFDSEKNWVIARSGLGKMNSLLEVIDDVIGKNASLQQLDLEDVTRILDGSYKVLQDGIKLTRKLMDLHADDMTLAADVLDGFKNVLPEKIMNTLTYLVSVTKNVVRMTHHVAVIHEELEYRMYNVCKRHETIVNAFLEGMSPEIYSNVVKAFSELGRAEGVIEQIRKHPVADVLCADQNFQGLLGVNSSEKSRVRELVCSADGKDFLNDVYAAFEFPIFQTIVEDTLDTFIKMALTRPVPIEKSNLTSSVRSVRSLMNYLENLPPKRIDWSDFKLSEKWIETFEDTRSTGRKDLLLYHLSIAKSVGLRSLSYITIKPDLENMDIIADVILKDLKENPTSWISEVRAHKSELLESFYLTVSDRNKTLKILEYSNFTRSYCSENLPDLINYPERSNATLLKALVCRLSRAVHQELEMNVTAVELQEMTFKDRKPFDWTLFNGKIVDIYGYIDSLIQFDDRDEYYVKNLDELKRNFSITWTDDLTVEDGWQIAVGLLCRVFELVESPLFGIQGKSGWNDFYALAWSVSIISDKIEAIIDDIRSNSTKLSDVIGDMPETETLFDAVLRNLPTITLDMIDVFNQKNPVHYVKSINDYRKNEPDWPCASNQSIGEVLELRAGTKEVIQHIEKIICNSTGFVNEWTEQPTFVRVTKIFKSDEPGQVPAFNWTSGYVRFRGIVSKFIGLFNSSVDLLLSDEQSLRAYGKTFVPEIKRVFDENRKKVEGRTKSFLDFLDMEIDENIEAFQGNLTVEEAWMLRKTRGVEDIFVIVKFGSKVLHDLINLSLEILKKAGDSKNLNVLDVLGFTSRSVVSIVRERLSYIVATILYGVSDPHLDHRIYKALSNNSGITCSKIFDWFVNYKVGLTDDEYQSLKNFTCDQDPLYFNGYFDLYLEEAALWRRPVREYRGYFFSLASDLHEFVKSVEDLMNKNVTISPPVDADYFNGVARQLKSILDVPRVFTSMSKAQRPASGWTTYRLLIEGLSEALKNAALLLKDQKMDLLHLWDLVKPGDVRQLMKFVEAHPAETLALAATLSTFNASKNNSLVPFEDLRHEMCSLRFNSDFWKEQNRSYYLSNLCNYDAYQLLKSATSEEFLDVVIGKSTTLERIDPLVKSLTRLFEVLQARKSRLTLESNLFNVTTWKILSNDTKQLIHNAEESWVHKMLVELIPLEHEFSVQTFTEIDLSGIHSMFQNHPLNSLRQLIELTESWMDIVSGGDIWQKLRITFENSKIKTILNLIEDTPNLVITIIDTFINSERLNDFMEKFLIGQVNLCDIEKFLIPSSYIRKKGILTSITNFCQKIVSNSTSIYDFKPLTPADVLDKNLLEDISIKNSDNKARIRVSLNETYFMDSLERFQSTLLRTISDGPKPAKVPSWWVSFREGTLVDFKKQFETRDVRALAHAVVKKLVKNLKDILSLSAEFRRSCSWCSTRLIDIVNSQLSLHRVYSDVICRFKSMNVSSLQETMVKRLYWRKTIGMIENYDFLPSRNNVDDFMTAVEDSLHYVTDVVVDYKDPTGDKHLEECLNQTIDGLRNFSPAIYVKILVGGLDAVKDNLKAIEAAGNSDLLNYTRSAERFVPIWRPLRTIVKKSKVSEVDRFLPNASLNVNLLFGDRSDALCRKPRDCRNLPVFENFLNSKKSHKLLIYDAKLANYPGNSEISKLLVEALDFDMISGEISSWRSNESWSLTWLQLIIDHLMLALEESGSLLEIARKIDFQDVSNVLGVPDVADGVVNLVKDKTIDKLFAALNDIIEDVEPFLDPKIIADLHSIVDTFEGMEIFKNLGLLDMKYRISEMFLDWNNLRKFLVDEIKLSDKILEILSDTKVDMLSVFMKERAAMSLSETVCSPDKLKDMLNFEASKTSAEEVSEILCSLNSSVTQEITVTLIKNIDFEYVFKNLMSANVKNILKNANLSESEGKIIFDNIGVVGELMPLFKDKISLDMPSNESDDASPMTISGLSELMCGRGLISDNGEFYRLISKIEDTKKIVDIRELNSLPTEFCRNTYKSFLHMTGGKIIWSYVKPLIRGRILYTPNKPVIQKIMNLSNQTFNEMDLFGQFMSSVETTLIALADLTDLGDSLNDLKDIMTSKVMKIAVKTMSDGRVDGDLSNFDLSEIAWRLKKSDKIIKMIGMLNKLLECILIDRMVGFDTEEELELEARRLTDTNEFLAGVVFVDDQKLSKRSLPDDDLPDDVTYKIRMDVDFVPSTKRLKKQFWLPGPEASFIEDLRYLRGFVQLQDSIDRAIIEVKTGREQKWKTLSQQMPYPCWKYAQFQSTLYESQGLIICFFFGMMMCVGSAVRYIVWERESQNSMVMSVMGLKPWRNTFAWFITSSVELTVVVTSICIILIAGKILPHSDPIVLMILLLDYVFSIVTFCYMISTMFSSASLAAVTTVVMFLLTYMPYVIVIAMEASMELAFNLILSLSMSTSFCYGCLYVVRREVQGTGMTWSNIWEESSPGDPMSFGLVLIMIALDGCLYAAIGYAIVRYTNSGKGLPGLRSRSLWWTDTRVLFGRSSHLAFVNNLYFTNDVLHNSSIYQDEDSDTSNMTVSEKQVGVRFEAVRKVFQTEQGECVAVDDFTLKLCKGEVTSLLGRNGAGKTTIIKMLTGMIPPTCGEIYLDGEEGEKPDIGVCPQDNVLIDTLTPREHMMFYAKLKKPLNKEEMLKNVNSMLSSLELGKQEHEPVSRLSGGTKRRLCVALAFLGSPKLVILDEPGAGVDPAARRRIWHLIDQHRYNRTVLLSTHHLDEADMLSDTVVVMHKGKILCTGSPLTLKTTYGQGYWLNIAYPLQDPSNNCQKDQNRGEKLQQLLASVVPNARVDASSSEVTINLPYLGKNGAANDITRAIKILEDNRKDLEYSRISMDCDTLERVFLKLCATADSGSNGLASLTNVGNAAFVSIPDDEEIMTELSRRPTAIGQARAILKKRMWHFARDWRAPLAALILPTIFVAVAMGFSLIRPPSTDEPPLKLNAKLYDKHVTYFYSIDNISDLMLQRVSSNIYGEFGGDYAGAWQIQPNDTGNCECREGQQVCNGVSKAVEGLFQTLPGRPTLDWIVSTFNEYIEKRYGGWSLSHWKEDPLFIVWYNNKGHHSLPAYLNSLNEAILQANGVPGHITTFNHPLKLSSDQLNRTSLLQHVADVGVALVLLIAFSLVAAQGTRELVRERLSEEKRILYLAGVHPITYWTTAFLWDFIVFIWSIALAVVVFEIFALPAYVARDNLPGICILLVLFAWASIPFTHFMEKTFDDATLSNMVLFCLNTFVGVICLATILVIDIVGKSEAAKETRDILHNLMLFFPQYALGDALVQMSTNDITAELLERFNMDTYKSPLGWSLIGQHYVYLFIVGVIFYVINIAIECRCFPNRSKSMETVEKCADEDDDVVSERWRIKNNSSDDLLKTINLRKEYKSVYGKNVAVKNLSIGVKSGTCFGLLGINGAGKSTTFKMLTTELMPTSGRIVLKDRQLNAHPLITGEMGYCPQTDALDGFLTPHQSLTIHGEICGLRNLPILVESMLKRFDLLKYAHQRVSSLSGGNKRKLCAAISMMSPVSVVLMDEPTSGMDPASKELVASAIRRIVKKDACVIMTSHSVAECEKLCNRVGILAKAGLRCIGSPQHLKHKYGEGYVAFLRSSQAIGGNELKDVIYRYFSNAQIYSRQATALRLLIPHNQDILLSEIFRKLKCLAEELKATDYTLTQSSLDQVLVNFSEANEDDFSDWQFNSRSRINLNSQQSADTIHMDTF